MFRKERARCNDTLLLLGCFKRCRTIPPNYRLLSAQVLQWVLITLTTKSLIALLLCFSYSLITRLGHLLLHPLESHPRIELVVVMLVAPVCMNAAQFWVNDNILMSKKGYSEIGSVNRRECSGI